MTAEKFDLQQLQIASPCYERWENMTGDERVRHCASCKLNVYNVRELNKAEVEELVTRASGRVCMRLYRRWDGTVLTKDCPVGVSRARVRLASALLTAAAFVGVLLLPLLRLGSRGSSEPPPTFQERFDQVKEEAYEWPVFGTILEEISPRPRAIMGAMIRLPSGGSGHP
ncbi:hypothetical protein [Hyalangium rubrum]|uniref:Uncharacterized protein n=1 Tax=Hyalangium rubrum TaxID=3103134 RepID=A0ABU5H041_9BACT|nr:hypothetical protein [Hyalangium sp. s54d21]MDY7225475.1 hypothetical protein [Hyalangium sp. s54d21]